MDREPHTLWWQFVQDVCGDLTVAEAARRSGIHKSVFGRWRDGQGTTAEVAVRFARAFDVDVLRALTAAGVIRPEEADAEPGQAPVSAVLREASADELAREFVRRLHAAERGA